MLNTQLDITTRPPTDGQLRCTTIFMGFPGDQVLIFRMDGGDERLHAATVEQIVADFIHERMQVGM